VTAESEQVAAPAAPGARFLAEFADLQRVGFDLDGTLYDTRDFERPALAAVVEWLRERSGKALDGMSEALCARRESERHRPGLFDDILERYRLPPSWGPECAARFYAYPGTELAAAPSLREDLVELRSRGCRLALVTNGRASLQQRKLRLLGFGELFDVCIYCEPSERAHLKPANWGWQQLKPWRGDLPAGYVGDDPVDALFAAAGRARFVRHVFRNNSYGN
jgi:phosphoglycolate phosphatase-like HAD superfamily hydrolase